MTGSSVFAQNKENPQSNRVEEKTSTNKPNSIEAVGNKIEFKNESTNSILTITDEGNNAGTIELKDVNGLPDSSKKLINNNGKLLWGGIQLGTTGSAGGWIDTGTKIHTATLSDKVGIATANPNSLLSVGGIGNISASISGTSISSGGIGVYAESFFVGVEGRITSFGTGASYGGRFFSGTDGGIGVYGDATGSSAYAGYFVGRGYFSGNVGVGTENPLSQLSVGGDGNSNAAISGESSTGWGVFGHSTIGNGVVGSSNSLTGFAGYFIGRGYFAGNVGIGTENPISQLSVGGDGDLLAKIYAKNISTNGYAVYGDAITSTISGATNIGGYFSSNGEKGQGIYGKTIGDKGRGVYGEAIGTNGFGIYGEATGTNGIGIYGIAPTTGWAGYFVGNVKVTGSISTPSDIRFKKDIIPIKNALNSVRQLSGVTYNWKAQEFPERNFDNTKIQIGVIAQDVEKIFPQLVNTDQDGYKSVDYIKLSVVTLQAVKEQNEIIIAQESTIKELENRLSKIESLLDGVKFTSVSE
jgi:hypothetical protein